MKKVLSLVVLLAALIISACSSDEPNNDSGKLVVDLAVAVDADQPPVESIDFSDYSIVIVPQSGWVYGANVKDIVWPIDISVGSYTVAAVSPALEETDQSTICYYGEVNDVRIAKDETTSIVITMSRKEFPKSDLE